MANSFYEHSGYPPGSRARNSSQKLRAEFLAIEAGAQAIEAALDLKADAADLSETQAALALKADAADVSEVDNTSDADKPISTLTQAALDLKADYSALVDFNPATAGADKMLVTNATGDGWEYPSITAAGKALLDDADAAAQRATLGVPNDALTRSRKNLLVNGGFDVWQRGTSFSMAPASRYTADRWYAYRANLSLASEVNQVPFAAGQVAVPGNPTFYLSWNVDIAITPSGAVLVYRIPDVAKLSGETLTLSFYAKANAAKYIAVNAIQNFGSGGASEAKAYTYAEKTSLTTSWVRKTFTFTMPSVSGKTIGTGDTYTAIYIFMSWDGSPITGYPDGNELTGQEGVFDFANVQLEFGDTATDFEYRHPAEELALCQRYYETGTLRGPFSQYNPAYAIGPYCPFLVQKRVAPDVATGALSPIGHDGTPGTLSNANVFTRGFNPLYNWTGGTQGRSFFGQLTWSADSELY